MSSTPAPFHIAIDGPVAAGKGTISRLVAQRLNFLYVDTGAMYRMTGLLALRAGVNPEDAEEVYKVVKAAKMDMRNPTDAERDGRLTTVHLDGEDVSWKIRTEDVSAAASKVAQHVKVRQLLVSKQQEIAASQNVIMEGRDITFRVLPQADLKIYLTASDIVRARRRFTELLTKGQDVEFDTVYSDLISRDDRDMNRKTDPLHIVDEAWIVDTSDLEIDKVVDVIATRVSMLMQQKGLAPS